MRRKFLAFFFLLIVPAAAWAEETAVLLDLSGTVEYRLNAQDSWKPASRGLQVKDGNSVRTGEGSRAVLLFQNLSKVWLKPKTTLDIEIKSLRDNLISLSAGNVKVRVPHLRYRENFRVRTPTVVAAVRGTIFTIGEEDGFSIRVLFGEVSLDFTSGRGGISVTQGNGYENNQSVLLTRDKEIEGLEDWSPATPDSDRRNELVENEKKRVEVRAFAQQALSTERDIANTRDRLKEEDFAAGRTLVDVHGNLVRVDQRLDRPDSKTLQVTNIVKRTEYGSGGLRTYVYNGSAGARLDALLAKVQFNKELPGQINELPGFLKDNENSLKLDRSQLVVANMTDPNSVFTIGFFGVRNAGSGSDEITPDLYVGTLDNSGSTSGRQKLFNLTLDPSNLSVAGLTRFVPANDPNGRQYLVEQDGAAGELYKNSANKWVQAANGTQFLWLATENFVINNDGKVRNVSDYTNASVDFENLLKNSAFEVAVFAKADSANSPDKITDATNFAGGNAAKRNIDLVITPDIVISVIKTLATSGDVIKDTY